MWKLRPLRFIETLYTASITIFRKYNFSIDPKRQHDQHFITYPKKPNWQASGPISPPDRENKTLKIYTQDAFMRNCIRKYTPNPHECMQRTHTKTLTEKNPVLFRLRRTEDTAEHSFLGKTYNLMLHPKFYERNTNKVAHGIDAS